METRPLLSRTDLPRPTLGLRYVFEDLQLGQRQPARGRHEGALAKAVTRAEPRFEASVGHDDRGRGPRAYEGARALRRYVWLRDQYDSSHTTHAPGQSKDTNTHISYTLHNTHTFYAK